jgi:hypothetical protein
MIGFAPFDDGPRVKKRPFRRQQVPQKEQTECNYLVIFFVIGVILLAIGDVYKK